MVSTSTLALHNSCSHNYMHATHTICAVYIVTLYPCYIVDFFYYSPYFNCGLSPETSIARFLGELSNSLKQVSNLSNIMCSSWYAICIIIL